MRTSSCPAPRTARARSGLVLMALLLMLVLVGVSALVVAEVSATARAREQEAELLWIGEQYRAAIERYWRSTPGPRKLLPGSVEQLLVDDRFPNEVHHLRQRYPDPFDPTQDLEAIKWNNSLVGVHSTVKRPSIKRANFPMRYRGFETVEDSSEWSFVFVPLMAPAAPASPSNPGIPGPPGGGQPSLNPPPRR
jgi:hypothetical protein